MSPSSNNLSRLELQDQIFSDLNKAKAIITCTMFATEFLQKDMTLDTHTLYHVLWAADDYLENLEKSLLQLGRSLC